MIFHKIFRFTNFLIFCIWGLQSCTKDDLIETPADTDSETTENPYGMIRIAEKDLTPDVFKLMLQDVKIDANKGCLFFYTYYFKI